MDTTRFDALARLFDRGITRREASRGLMAGVAALSAGGPLLAVGDAAARKRRHKKRRKTNSSPANLCDGKNWCVDRSQTCGPAGGYGKCLVEAGGGNICGEILFQAASCTDCDPANCTDCRCVLAAGGGDRCNNGASGYDFICVRGV